MLVVQNCNEMGLKNRRMHFLLSVMEKKLLSILRKVKTTIRALNIQGFPTMN
jgi:hypothetical protein